MWTGLCVAIRYHNQWKSLGRIKLHTPQINFRRSCSHNIVQDLKLVFKGHSPALGIPVPQNSMRFLYWVGRRYHVFYFRGCQSFSLSAKAGISGLPSLRFQWRLRRSRKEGAGCRRREFPKMNFNLSVFATPRLLNHVESSWIKLAHLTCLQVSLQCFTHTLASALSARHQVETVVVLFALKAGIWSDKVDRQIVKRGKLATFDANIYIYMHIIYYILIYCHVCMYVSIFLSMYVCMYVNYTT